MVHWSFRKKITVGFLGIVILSAAVLIATQTWLVRASQRAAVEAYRDETLAVLAHTLAPALFAGDIATLERQVELLLASTGVRAVEIRDPTGGLVLARARETEADRAPPVTGRVVIRFAGRPVGELRIRVSDARFGSIAGTSLARFSAVVLFGLVLGAAALLGLVLREAEWFERLRRHASAIAEGAFDRRLPEHGPRETSQIARLVNRVLDALDEARRHADAERRRLATVFELLPHGVLELDLEGTIVAANPAYHRMLGHADGTLIGRRLWEIPTTPAFDCRAMFETVVRERPDPRPVHIEKIRTDGRVVRMRLDWTWLHDSRGRVRGILAVATDVTAEHEARRQLEESEKRFRDFAEAASDWFWETDAEDRIVFISRRFEEIFGIPRERFLGRRRDDIQAIVESPDWPHYVALRRARAPFRGFRYTLEDAWGHRHTVEVFGVPNFGPDGAFRGYRGVARDITDKVEAERRLRELAYFDSLTGLVNRTAFGEELDRILALAARRGARVALHVVDLDRFKEINDTFGHEAGDRLLVTVAERLRACVRRSDVVARLAGDELAVIQPFVRDAEEAGVLAERLVRAVRAPVELGEARVSISCSIGIALFPEDGRDRPTLLRHADIALYRVKERARDGYAFFHADMQRRYLRRIELERELGEALARDDPDEIFLVFQPRVDLADGRLLGAEALVRWRHPRDGAVEPATFVTLAERCGLVHRLGRLVLERACAQLRAWDLEGRHLPRLAVNLSPLQFVRRDIVEEIRAVLARSGVEASRVELEITESALMQETGRTIEALRQLADLGVELVLDDFGTGYSSLGYLKRFPIHRLKIDQSFVRGLPEVAEQRAIVRAILTLARTLGLGCVAEGVETERARELLLAEGCREGQGYLFDVPRPAEAFAERWLPAALERREIRRRAQGAGRGSG